MLCVSVNIGPVHLVSFNSEYYYYVQYGWEQIIRQYEWLERDLTVSTLCALLKPEFITHVSP